MYTGITSHGWCSHFFLYFHSYSIFLRWNTSYPIRLYIYPRFEILNNVDSPDNINLFFLYFSKGLPLNAAHERLCSLRGNSLNVANWAEVTPSTIPVPSDPGATTSISLMYLHAVFGLFQYARCIIVDKESPANALEKAPPDRKGCNEKS